MKPTRLALAIVLSTLPACGLVAGCPRGVSDFQNSTLAEAIGPGFIGAAGIPNRFVDSPQTEFRGYDVEITEVIIGARADQVMFVRVPDPIPGVRLGEEVLIVGRRGPGPSEISPAAGCSPLIPLGP